MSVCPISGGISLISCLRWFLTGFSTEKLLLYLFVINRYLKEILCDCIKLCFLFLFHTLALASIGVPFIELLLCGLPRSDFLIPSFLLHVLAQTVKFLYIPIFSEIAITNIFFCSNWSINNLQHQVTSRYAAAATAKSLQSCPTLCDPIDGGPPGSPVPGSLQARTLEWVAISFSNAWKGKVKVKLLSRVRLFAPPWSAAYQAPPSMGFSRQESWSGVPLPSPTSRYTT